MSSRLPDIQIEFRAALQALGKRRMLAAWARRENIPQDTVRQWASGLRLPFGKPSALAQSWALRSLRRLLRSARAWERKAAAA